MKYDIRVYVVGAVLATAACGDDRYSPPQPPSAVPVTGASGQNAVAVGGTVTSSRFTLAFSIGHGGAGNASGGGFSLSETNVGGGR